HEASERGNRRAQPAARHLRGEPQGSRCVTEDSRDGHEIRWSLGENAAGRFVVLPNGEQLKLYYHVFPDGNYTYLALPRGQDQLREFLTGIIEKEARDLRHEP